MNESFRATEAFCSSVPPGEDEPERPIPRPIDCITLYANSKECRDMVETICLYCPEPTFIPIFNNTISIDEKNHRDEPCPPAMFLAAAAQVLIFAPSHWDPELKLVQTSDYPRRYPINQGFSPTKTIAGRFSMEDLNRALYLIFTVNNRRGKANLLSGIPTKRTGNTRWMGYHDPSWNSTEMELEGTEIIVDGHTEAQLDAEEMLMDQQDAENNKGELIGSTSRNRTQFYRPRRPDHCCTLIRTQAQDRTRREAPHRQGRRYAYYVQPESSTGRQSPATLARYGRPPHGRHSEDAHLC
ncbi:hypothetical protein SNK04_013696 [Fusarium graminearum]